MAHVYHFAIVKIVDSSILLFNFISAAVVFIYLAIDKILDEIN